MTPWRCSGTITACWRGRWWKACRRRLTDLDHPVAEDPAEVVFGRPLLGGELRDGVDGRAPGDAHLDGAEIVEIARHGGLGGGDAVGGQQLHEVGLARHRLFDEQLRDAVLPLGLGDH
jgi:hypothetical protein